MTEKLKFRIPNFDGGAGSQARATSPTRRLLEETKLSRLPAINRRSACVVCSDGKFDPNNDFQQSTKICGNCLGCFAQVGVALDAHADRKVKAVKLAQWEGGNKS